MRKNIFLFISLFWIFSACKKQRPICCVLNSRPILFEIVDKNGNSVVHSVKDILLVSYVNNGITVTKQLDIFKAQKSATDTTKLSAYNGFVLSDADPTIEGTTGYISTPSSGSGGVSFKVSLNNQLLGTIYSDYWAAAKAGMGSPNPYFTLNGNSATEGIVSGLLTAGYPSPVGYAINQYFVTSTDIDVYVLSTGQ